jgi:hypothetical protein
MVAEFVAHFVAFVAIVETLDIVVDVDAVVVGQKECSW